MADSVQQELTVKRLALTSDRHENELVKLLETQGRHKLALGSLDSAISKLAGRVTDLEISTEAVYNKQLDMIRRRHKLEEQVSRHQLALEKVVEICDSIHKHLEGR